MGLLSLSKGRSLRLRGQGLDARFNHTIQEDAPMVSSSLVLLSLVLGLAPAQDTHTIKIKKSAKGDVIKVENTETVNTTVVATAAGAEVANKKDKNSKNEVYQETVVDK